MKHNIKNIKAILTAVLLLLIPLQQVAAQDSINTQNPKLKTQNSKLNISLLTAGPGDQVWSLYGHTAIRYQNDSTGQDLAINYGMFSFEKSFFIARFVLGLTDYEMGITTMDHFMRTYSGEGRWVVQQELNLTDAEKQAITQALEENSLPQNVVYRYNYFYDNCTTRARDMIINHLNAKAVSTENQWDGQSYRTMIHQWNEAYPWSRFGNDLLLGVGADLTTTKEASRFLPDSVRKEFNHTILTDPDGSQRRLVKSEEWLIPPTASTEQPFSIFSLLTPTVLFALLFAIILLLTLLQRFHKVRTLLWLDALLLLATGLAGIILFVMIFSQHPTVRVNLQILLLNPLNLLLLIPVLRSSRRGQPHPYWKLLTLFLALFLLGGILQTYAEGMYLLCATLLLRCWKNIRG